MANEIYRSVKAVLQNSTNEKLTVQGTAVLVGQWADKVQSPTQGWLFGEQSSVTWMSVSTELCVGTSAFVRFGSAHGYMTIRWTLPWMGPFKHVIDAPPEHRVAVSVDDSHPDAIVMLATIHDCWRPQQASDQQCA